MQAARDPCRLKATDLGCRRGDRVLFAGLSLELAPGEACHIIGANGIGKSSLIRILAGLAAPWAGTIERDGGIGLIDDRSALDPQQPLGHALDFWARIDGRSDATNRALPPSPSGEGPGVGASHRAQRPIESPHPNPRSESRASERPKGEGLSAVATAMGLADLLDVPVRYLSTGQRKRAALARLVTQNVPIWLLDEPLNGLDSAGAALTLTLTSEHCAAGGICVVASHQPFAHSGIVTLDLADYAA